MKSIKMMYLKAKKVKAQDENGKIRILQRFNDKKVLKFLEKKLRNFTIELGIDYIDSFWNLMSKGILEGWCWQVTESAILFFNDNAYIERGTLNISKNRKYPHAWICFELDKVYVFDPCLRIVVEKELYYYVFGIENIQAVIKAKDVKMSLSKRAKEDKNQTKSAYILGNNDVKSIMYKNNTEYTSKEMNGRFISIIAHFYCRN